MVLEYCYHVGIGIAAAAAAAAAATATAHISPTSPTYLLPPILPLLLSYSPPLPLPPRWLWTTRAPRRNYGEHSKLSSTRSSPCARRAGSSSPSTPTTPLSRCYKGSRRYCTTWRGWRRRCRWWSPPRTGSAFARSVYTDYFIHDAHHAVDL